MPRSPRPPKIPLKRITILLDEITQLKIDEKAQYPKYKGNRSYWIIEAILEKLGREN